MKCKNCNHMLVEYDIDGFLGKQQWYHWNKGVQKDHNQECFCKGCTCVSPVPDNIENLNKDMFNAFAGFFR